MLNYRLSGLWEMLLVIPQDAVILFLAMGDWFHCCSNWTSMRSSRCWGMPHGLCQTSAEGSHNQLLSRFILLYFPVVWSTAEYSSSRLCWLNQMDFFFFFWCRVMNRLSLLFQHLPASSTQLTRKSLLMLVGRFRTYLMEAMTKFKQWLKLVSALGSWSFFCVYLMFEFVCLLILHSRVMLIVVYFICFRYPSPAVLIPALRTVGNIVTGDDVQTQVVDLSVLNS